MHFYKKKYYDTTVFIKSTAEAKIYYFNKGAQRRLGKKPNDLYGMSRSVYFQFL